MKIFLVIALIVICGIIGVGISGVYKQRKKFFDSFLFFLLNLKTDIGFSANKLTEIISVEKENCNNKDFRTLLTNYYDILNSGEKVSKELLFNNVKIINEQEKDDMFMFFKQLGKTDIYSQIDIIKNKIETTKTMCDKLKKECEKYCPLYTKLGILAGLFLALIII